MVKFGVAASDELKIIGRLLTYKYRHAQGLDSNEFADVVDLLNVSINGETYNASHFPNDGAIGPLDSKDTERKTVRLCYGTDPELFVIQVIDNLIRTDGNEALRAWLNGLPGKSPGLTCSEMKCNWFKDTQQLSRDRTNAGGVMGKEALVKKILMPYVTGAGSGRERVKWPRRFCV